MWCKKKPSQSELDFRSAPVDGDRAASDEPADVRSTALHGLPDGATYLSVRQVMEVRIVSRTTVWRWKMDGKLPKPCRFSGRTQRWHIDDIRAFLARVAKVAS